MLNELLATRFEDFLAYKRSLGYIYKSGENTVSTFLKFCSIHHPEDEMPTEENVMDYVQNYREQPLPESYAAYLREFSKYLNRNGIAAYLLPERMLTKHGDPVPPYFFKTSETDAFFCVCDSIKPMKGQPGRELVLPALFRMLYCCGMRCCEVRKLKVDDVDLDERKIIIRDSKGPNTRQIFIKEEFADYLKTYHFSISLLFSQREYFFPSPRTRGMVSAGFVNSNFRRLWLEAFPDFEFVDNRPRAYDFRHNFAVMNLNRWASEGADVNAKLTYLSKYMGHKNISHTLYYFHFVPSFYEKYREIADTSSMEDEDETE